jgi:6,7-dimethyl-8-ribityllumazine synthase
MKIGVIVSQFNVAITDRLLSGAEKGLKEQAIGYEVFRVPGAFEIPLMAAELAASGHYQGLIALGVVIKGETDHYDMICRACVDGIRQVMLEHRIPITFEVLMVSDAKLAMARAGDRPDNNKGYQAAYNAVSMVKHLQSLNKSPGQ